MNHRQAVTDFHREIRTRVTTGSAGRLAEVEKAALAWQTKVIDEKSKLESSGDFASQYIGKQIAILAHQLITEKTELEKIVEQIQNTVKQVPDELPARTEEHRDISAHFKTLKGDERLQGNYESNISLIQTACLAQLSHTAPTLPVNLSTGSEPLNNAPLR